jgi:hypothetical protein
MAFATIDVTKGITGTIPVANGGTGLASGTTGQFLKFTGTTTLASSTSEIQSKAGYFTYNMSSGSNGDTQAITGVGFTPKAVFINCLVNAGEPWSVGMQGDGTGTYDKNSLTWYNTANNNEMTYNRDNAFGLWTSGSDILRGSITTFGADGFTVTYTHQNSPSGTAEFMYLAVR